MKEEVKEEIKDPGEAPKAAAEMTPEAVKPANTFKIYWQNFCSRFQWRAWWTQVQAFWKGDSCQRMITHCKTLLSLLKQYSVTLWAWSVAHLAQGTEKIKTLWQGEHQRKLMIGGGVVLALILGFVAWEVRSVYHSVGKVVLSPALYREMSRPLVVRFDEKGMFSLIRVKLAFLTRDAGIVDYLSTHETELKESCVEVLAKEKSDHLLTRTGKEALLGHLLEAANQVVHQDSSINATQKVEAVLLQEFVMQ